RWVIGCRSRICGNIATLHLASALSTSGENGMNRRSAHTSSVWASVSRAVFFGLVVTMPAAVAGQAPVDSAHPLVNFLARDEAVRQALANNLVLRTVRQQRGLVEAGVVMSRTYPFNPSLTSIVAQNSGPESAGITNRVFLEDYVVLELEL